jgi:hypothetical protein
VQALCTRAIWLDRGVVAAEGATPAVVGKYLQGARPVDEVVDRPRMLGESIELRRFSVTPNPVASGGAIELSMTIGATAPVKLGEIAVLIYSSLETRVAIIDLRSANLPARLDANEQWSARATVASLNLVDGDYRLGLFGTAATSRAMSLDLAELAVHAGSAPRARRGRAHRGFRARRPHPRLSPMTFKRRIKFFLGFVPGPAGRFYYGSTVHFPLALPSFGRSASAAREPDIIDRLVGWRGRATIFDVAQYRADGDSSVARVRHLPGGVVRAVAQLAAVSAGDRGWLDVRGSLDRARRRVVVLAGRARFHHRAARRRAVRGIQQHDDRQRARDQGEGQHDR